MKIIQIIVVFTIASIGMTSCVSTKKFNAKDAELQKAKTDLNDCQTNLAKGQIANKKLTEQVKDLTTQVTDEKTQLDSANNKLAAGSNNDLLATLKNLNILSPD